MVSLNDVLLAMSNIPVDDPIAEIWGRGLQGGYEIIEYTGTLPITITADGTALIDYCIYGNTVQDGTPTPENPVDVVGCGVRTENLFDKSTVILGKYINAQGVETNSTTPTPLQALNHTDYIEIQPNTNYTYHYKYSLDVLNMIALCWFDASKNLISRNTKNVTEGEKEYTLTGTSPANAVFCIINFTGYLPNANMELSFNSGSTALPYEPYGYKLPMTVSDGNTVQTVPIYLGEVETTRRIKKLVLTGEEGFLKNDGQSTHYLYYASGSILSGSIRKTPILCNELPATSSFQTVIGINTKNAFGVVYFNFGAEVMNSQPSGNTVAGLKKYLAAQYAAGTPVTIWYVLAEPETGIVNEPLMKIGDYADTVSMEQAGVSIPTFAGTTVIDYDRTPKPSQMYIKYRR